MGRDFMVKVFYGFFVNDDDANTIKERYNNDEEEEEDGWFMLLEKLEKEGHPVEVEVIADDNVKDHRLALAARESSKRMYVNENNEIHKITDLTVKNKGWNAILEIFCSEIGITFHDPEWWLCTEGE